ncbi:MAG: host attachment protein, partial [Rhodanobacteraceae bacterium]
MQRIPTATWILIADGTEARLLANVGTAVDVSLKQERMLGPSNLDDDGPSGHRPPESDGQSTDEAKFAKQLARWLNA